MGAAEKDVVKEPEELPKPLLLPEFSEFPEFPEFSEPVPELSDGAVGKF